MPIAWAAGIAAVGGLASASVAGNASQNAAQAQEQAAAQAQQTQLQELQANIALQTPARNLGYGADALLSQLYGLPNPNSNSTSNMYPSNAAATGALGGAGGYNFTGTSGYGPGGGAGAPVGPGGTAGLPGNAPPGASSQFANFYNSPGYQFTLGAGTQAINRGAAAGGNLYAPQTLNNLGMFAEGTASNQYNNYVQQLMGLAGIGGTAVAGSQNAITGAGNNISQAQLISGSANASGILGQGGAFAGAVNNAGGALGNYSMLSNYYNNNNYNPAGSAFTQNTGLSTSVPPLSTNNNTYSGLPVVPEE